MKRSGSTLFKTGIWLKGVNGGLELLGGLLLAVVPESTATRLILAIARFETGPELRDWVLRGITDGIAQVEAESTFALFYLISHGVIKVFLAVALLRNIRWAAPVALAVFGLLAGIEIVRFALHPSVAMGLIIAIDLFVLGLIFRHWKDA